jgi:hypothetical protein
MTVAYILRRVLALALPLLLAACQAATPQEALPAMVSGTVQVGPHVIPLPPGEWRLLYREAVPGMTRDAGRTFVTRHEALLVQEQAGRVAGMILAHSSLEPGTGLYPQGICTTANAMSRHVEAARWNDLHCFGVTAGNAARPVEPPPLLRALYETADTRPGWLPGLWLTSNNLLNRHHHFLWVDYRFAPSVLAPETAATQSWRRGSLTAPQQAFFNRMEAWTAAIQPALLRSLAGEVPPPLPALP